MRGDRKWAIRHWQTMIHEDDSDNDDIFLAIKCWSTRKGWMKLAIKRHGDTVRIYDIKK
jgi:hypothetical protein